MKEQLGHFLDDFNGTFPSQTMSLVFFDDAIDHILRLMRVLLTPRGSAVLVGLGGSGRTSLTKLASYICSCTLFGCEIRRGYCQEDFREDLKKAVIFAGVKRKPAVFFVGDGQIIDESFLEDLNSILNNGEIPGLFANDETKKIIAEVTPHVPSEDPENSEEAGSDDEDLLDDKIGSDDGVLSEPSSSIRDQGKTQAKKNKESVENVVPAGPSKTTIWNYFVSCLRDNLHIVIAMSPTGEEFRARVRNFPALVSGCTIDWYDPWPTSALSDVSKEMLSDLPIPKTREMHTIEEVSICHFTGLSYLL